MMNRKKISDNTGDYHAHLIKSLTDQNEAAAYLQVAFDEYQNTGNSEAFLLALKNVAEAKGGLTSLSKKTHLNRQSLYRTLSSKGNPRLQTLGLLFKALGFHISIEPA